MTSEEYKKAVASTYQIVKGKITLAMPKNFNYRHSGRGAFGEWKIDVESITPVKGWWAHRVRGDLFALDDPSGATGINCCAQFIFEWSSTLDQCEVPGGTEIQIV